MNPKQYPTATPWPNNAKCAISFTMDNLGEAQDVNKGLWPRDKALGHHSSVLTTLPRMLDLLDGQHNNGGSGTGNGTSTGIKATYFAESWSLAVYPAAVRDLLRRGHEVAWHGYQHEAWHGLSAAEEEANFERSFAAAVAVADGEGVRYRGFRPPGGEINGERTMALLRRYGVEYVSPLGKFGIFPGPGSGDGDGEGDVVVLPFEWEAVDAFWYMDRFAPIRTRHGVPEGAPGPEAFREYLAGRIEEVKREGGYMSVLFHPFLQAGEDEFGVLGEVLRRIGGDDEIWCAPCGEVARWVREHKDRFGSV